MACPTLHTGVQFLGTSLQQLDCYGRTIGAYGYGALADPSSPVSLALGALLTICVGLFGIRLMLDTPVRERDVVDLVLRIGIVLLVATSWPAWRVLGYDLVFDGPMEIAQPIIRASALPDDRDELGAGQQRVDNAIIALTALSNRGLTATAAAPQTGGAYGDTVEGVALADKTGLAWGRISFLIGAVAPFAIMRIGAGLLLAVAPLMVTFLLFGQTLGLFIGWLRGLAFVALGSVCYTVVMGVELAMLEPWIVEAVGLRSSGNLTPSAPTELVVLTSVCGLFQAGLLLLIGRIVFQPAIVARWAAAAHAPHLEIWQKRGEAAAPAAPRATIIPAPTQAMLVADAVSLTLRREGGGQAAGAAHGDQRILQTTIRERSAGGAESAVAAGQESLGNSYRRTSSRSAAANARRDSLS